MMKVKLTDIIDAIEMTDQSSEYFIDQETGEIVCFNDLIMGIEERDELSLRLDEHGFYRLSASFDNYSIMENFVYSLDKPVRDSLALAIRGRGAFSRFKSGIRRFGIEQQWYDYQQNAYRKFAAEWCAENHIEYE